MKLANKLKLVVELAVNNPIAEEVEGENPLDLFKKGFAGVLELAEQNALTDDEIDSVELGHEAYKQRKALEAVKELFLRLNL